MSNKKKWNRREFLGSATAASMAFTIVPRHVLGGKGFVAPSDKLTLAHIGCGTEGLREMTDLITNPNLQIVAVCDVNKRSTNYVDWSPNDIRDCMRRATGEANWGEGLDGIPGGRDIGKEMVEKYYARTRPGTNYKGCASYEDFRELLEKEKDVDAVKIMTPDHLHAFISIAAMKKGKHVAVHKPIANRIYEAKLSIATAKKTGVSTHLMAWSKINGDDTLKQMLDSGEIGTLKEIHNWSHRPMWPQWTQNPKDTPPVPTGLNWDLWLGPVPDRPYHPNYTNAVFRGWYDFGGGSIADMGHYSLWPLFQTIGVHTPPISAEARGTTTCMLDKNVSVGVVNNVAFPYSCTIHFKFPKQESLPAFDLFWYDGGMKPPTPDELDIDNIAMPLEGMMFVGTKGKILAGFLCEEPQLLPKSRMAAYTKGKQMPKDDEGDNNHIWIDAFRNKKESPGSFLNAGPVTETILLGGIALRAGRKVVYDSVNMKIPNYPEAEKFLYREYRKGWEL